MDFLLQNMRELWEAWRSIGYWLAYATTVGLLLTCLLRLHRVKEKHHGYYGAVLAATPWTWVRIVGWVLLVDDLYQHWVQASALEDDRPIRSDFSPVHVAYVKVYRCIVKVLARR